MIPRVGWWKKRQTPLHPIFLEHRLAFKSFNQDLPIGEYEFVVLDTELTGLDPRRDEILSIGAVQVRDLRIVAGNFFYTYLQPVGQPVNEQTLIHRITPDRLKDAPSREQALLSFVKFCSTSLLAGHCLGIDMDFLNRDMLRHYHAEMIHPCLDTMKLARILTEKESTSYYDRYNHVGYDLAGLSKRFKLPTFQPHDALQDAMQTAYLFIYLVRKLQCFGLVSLKDFFKAGLFHTNLF
ncbi:MAG: 3'-5' exonuclease [Desulfobulbaceae bacterium]|nr:3'-5' exonuclease [Desulfobulbaceae bacterium]